MLILALYHMLVVIVRDSQTTNWFLAESPVYESLIEVVSKLVISTVQMALSKIQGNEDTEWKFAKTELILTYFNAHAEGFPY